jgi:hypothetical protein
MQSAKTDRGSNEEFGMFLMKTTSKTIFSFMAAGLLLSAFASQGLAQSSPTSGGSTPSSGSSTPEKPLSKSKLKKLCKTTPTDPRCPSPDSMTTPSGSMSAPASSSPGTMSAPATDSSGAGSTGGSTSGGSTGGGMTPTSPTDTAPPSSGGSAPKVP